MTLVFPGTHLVEGKIRLLHILPPPHSCCGPHAHNTTKINDLVNQSINQCIFKVKYLTWVDIAAPGIQRLLSENARAGAGYHPMSCWSWRLQGTLKQCKLPTNTVLGCLPELDDKTLLLNTADTFIAGLHETRQKLIYLSGFLGARGC